MKKNFIKINSLIKRIVSCGMLSAVMFSNIVSNAPQLLKDNVTPTSSVISTFYTEPKDSADVVFLGSSTVYRYIGTTQLYSKYGITALNYATPALDFNAVPGLLQEVIDHQHPKLIVIEIRTYINNCDNFVEGVKYKSREMMFRNQYFEKLVQSMPNSKNRAKVANDVAVKSFGYDPVKWQHEHLYSNYKNIKKFESKSWKKKYENYKEKFPKEYEFKDLESYNGDRYKGTVASLKIKSIKKNDFSKYTKKNKIKGAWLDTLNDAITAAKECGTEVMFLSTPYYVSKKNIRYENAAGSIITKNGFKYLNLNKYYKEIGLDFSRDFYEGIHTNISGMVKVTNYVGKYIVKNYKLGKTKLSKSEKKSWQNATNLWIKEVRTPGLKKVKSFKATKVK